MDWMKSYKVACVSSAWTFKFRPFLFRFFFLSFSLFIIHNISSRYFLLFFFFISFIFFSSLFCIAKPLAEKYRFETVNNMSNVPFLFCLYFLLFLAETKQKEIIKKKIWQIQNQSVVFHQMQSYINSYFGLIYVASAMCHSLYRFNLQYLIAWWPMYAALFLWTVDAILWDSSHISGNDCKIQLGHAFTFAYWLDIMCFLKKKKNTREDDDEEGEK